MTPPDKFQVCSICGRTSLQNPCEAHDSKTPDKPATKTTSDSTPSQVDDKGGDDQGRFRRR